MNKSESETQSSSNSQEFVRIFNLVVAYLSLSIIFVGIVFNTACFFIFRFNKELNKMSSSVYLSYCSITDTLSLFDWNLDHFLSPVFNTGVENPSLFACRFFSFIQYFSLQSSAWLLSFTCIDRFFSVASVPGSFMSRLPFSTTKSANIWSLIILAFMFVLNLQLLILNGYLKQSVNIIRNDSEILYYQNSTSVICYNYPPTFKVSYFWDSLNLYIYNFVPFLIMLVFNLLLVYKIVRISNPNLQSPSSKNQKSKNKQTISLVIITFLFVVMTLPSNVFFGYFQGKTSLVTGSIFVFWDFLGFLNRASLFFSCFITNLKFRSIVLGRFSRRIYDVQTATTRKDQSML